MIVEANIIANQKYRLHAVEFNTELETPNDLGYHKQSTEKVTTNLKHLDLQQMKY